MNVKFVQDDEPQTLRLKLDGGNFSNNQRDSVESIISEAVKQEVLKKFFKPEPKEDKADDKKPKAIVYTRQDVFCIATVLTIIMFWTGPFVWAGVLNTLHSYAGIVTNIAK